MDAPDGFPLGPKHDEHGEIRMMVRSGGYVMVRRPRMLPFILTEKEWRKLSDAKPSSPCRRPSGTASP